nr:transporter substrate-binding domain-containing protein [uncultured Pseudodesulfovibrio sp.]
MSLFFPFRLPIVVSLLFLLLLSSPVQAQEKLIVAIDKTYAPLSLVTPDGKPAGLLVEMWQLWSKNTGIAVEFASGTWEETIEMVKSGKADVHSGLFKNSKRSKWLNFSDTLHAIKSTLYHRVHSKCPSLCTLKNEKIGIVADTYQQDYLREKHPHLSIASYESHEALLTGLIAGEIDIIFDEVPTVSRNLARLGWQGLVDRTPNTEVINTVHAAVLKTRTALIKRIDDGFRTLNPALLAAIDKRWIIHPQDRFYHDVTAGLKIELTDKEKEFLHKKTSITLTATPNWPPFEMEQADGSYTGIAADFIRVAAKKVGLSIKPVFDTDWDAHMTKLKKGKLDVAPGLNETSKRLKHFTFTQPYIEYYSAIFTRRDREDIVTPNDLAGKTVALEEGYAIARNLPTDRPDINIMLVKSTQEALEVVSAGKADAYIGNQVVASYLIKKYTLPNLTLASLWRTDLPGQLRFAVSKDEPLLRNILQKGLDAITKQEREAILTTYLDASGFQQKVFSLTDEEWDWLHAHPRIKVGIDPQSAPFEFIDEQKQVQGISAEYIDFIKEKIKVEMTPTIDLSWSEVLQSAKQGRIDILTSIAKTPVREEFLLFTEPYIEFPIVIFSPKEAPLVNEISDIASGRIAVVEGYAAQEYLTYEHPKLKLLSFPTVNKAINALAMGEVNWFINDLATGIYAIEQNGLTNLKVAASTEWKLSLSMAVRKDYPELVNILNKALNVVTDEQAAEFKNKWLALKFEHGLDMSTVFTWVLPISGGVLLILGLIVLWNRKLGSEITERKKAQAELADTMKSLDEKNQMLEGLSSKLAKYLSPQVYDSIFAGDRDVSLSTERKKLTVFFSDIKNFTQTTDDMQPEDLTALLNNYFTEMSSIAMEYGATIDKFIGDAMLMFFGDPETKGVKEDAELCVRMAFAMQKRMAELEKEWQAMGYDKPFKMRVGINTGYCNVGNFGSDTRMDYTIIGGEVNLAARLEGQADPGGVLISSETYILVKELVNAKKRNPLSVKGIRRSIHPYSIVSLRNGEEDYTERNHTIKHEEKGFTLSINLEGLTPEKRKKISSRLLKVAQQLKK